MSHPSEAGHYYTRKGEPFYSLIGSNGKERNVTVRDARKLGLVPSVTTVIRCAAAPGLERWKLDQMLHAALTLPRGDTEPEAEWISRVWTDSQETAKKAAERGTAIHAAIQGYYEGKSVSEADWPHVFSAANEIADWMAGTWSAERSFAHSLGFGGKVDLSHIWAVVDFKTKEFGPDADLKTWDEQAMQLAAYRMGLGLEKAKAAIVYVSVTNPGLSRLIEIPEEELQRGWEMFVYLLGYWKARNKFNSAYDLQESQAA